MSLKENKRDSKRTSIFGHTFKNPQLLQWALTHPSIRKNNEFQRLEFLGDRVLNLEVALMIFKAHPTYTAGQMSVFFSSLVCADKINEITNEYIVPHLVSYGKITKNVVADTFEAVIGALFLDGANVNGVIHKMWWKDLNKSAKPIENDDHTSSYKTTLNLIGGDECKYTHLAVRKDDDSYFQAQVSLNGFIGTGMGKSKKEADEQAAKNILNQIYEFSKKY